MHWVAVMKRLLSPCKPRSQSAVGQKQSQVDDINLEVYSR